MMPPERRVMRNRPRKPKKIRVSNNVIVTLHVRRGVRSRQTDVVRSLPYLDGLWRGYFYFRDYGRLSPAYVRHPHLSVH